MTTLEQLSLQSSLESLHRSLRAVNFDQDLFLGNFFKIKKQITGVSDEIQNNGIHGDKYYLSTGVQEVLYRLVHCLTAYQHQIDSDQDSTKVGKFSCLVSSPKQHESYNRANGGATSSSSGEGVFSSDPMGAFYANLSLLLHEISRDDRPCQFPV
uniref:Uncharacterized protein n=1 Tax=Cacopsylla melanoneura TaxID=428564 RepID=A0A8D8QCW1_9HEMI